MSIAAEEDGVDADGVPPRSIRFADLPRQSLDQGRGSAREVWADLDPDLTLRWQLRVLEIKDSTGLLVGPAGTHHFVVGLAGPQVAVRNTESSRVLRRDHVMPVLSATVYFERPKLRPPGASSLIVLTFAAGTEPPEFAIRTTPPDTALAAGTQLLLTLRGTVRVDGVEAAPGTALLLDPNRSHPLQAASAQLLTVHRPGSQPEP
ncbi:hypothetical protein E3T61_09640 [Cryobacterium lactosi]|uniref:HutD family protein n=1 Tax=Cryobacterium lactosi TaxID=1259202 RepID=A0A4R9BVE5_9MICO|nr:hypothetical protein [Cryobacterium lactosi]TFD91120.1 hypothetical protein E3T61_09640 [Cryobacterium lactosi]